MNINKHSGWRQGAWILILSAGVAQAADRGVGIGVMLGEPTGLSFKKWVGESQAFDAALGWSFIGDNGVFNFHMDYLWHDFRALRGQESGPKDLSLFYGIGGRIKTTSQVQVGLRIPLGINYQAGASPLELFVEAVPILNLTPSTTVNVNGGVGLRLYFQ